MIGRLHHCIGDGLALVDVLLGMTDEVPEPLSAVQPKARARDLLAKDGVASAKTQRREHPEARRQHPARKAGRRWRGPRTGSNWRGRGRTWRRQWTKKGDGRRGRDGQAAADVAR